jgi:hypothetical protein
MPDVCYLCGLPIHKDASADHVPPQQFFARPIRQAVNLNKLATLPTHAGCNTAYGKDEEYFVWSLAPIAAGSQAADALNATNAVMFRSGRAQGLGLKTLAEFEERPGGLYLPHGLIVKRVEGDRIKRVAWKIVRGLYRIETGAVLPENTVFALELVEPENREPPVLGELSELVKAQPSRGAYPGIFDYKYLDARAGSHRLHGWGMLLWDRIMAFVGHFHPV